MKGKKRDVDTNEIKHLINRVKQGEFDQGDALLIEKLLSILLTIVSLLERKHTSIQRMKELLFGMKEKKLGNEPARSSPFPEVSSGREHETWNCKLHLQRARWSS